MNGAYIVYAPFIICKYLHRFSVLNRDYFVRALDCPQPVGDYEDGFALDEF